jgi:DNA topoisomerase VI subunit B
MIERPPAPTVFTTDRLLEFTSTAELSKLVGAPPAEWPIIAVKELVDNALDNCEDTGTAPEIAIAVSTKDRTITVRDNGSGIAPDVVERVADLKSKTSSREAYVAPTRGQQGNAVQTILAMSFALDGSKGETVIEAHGAAHTITVTMDHVHRVPQISISRQRSSIQNGTSITLRWPVSASSKLDDAKAKIVLIGRGFAFLNPHLTLRLQWDGETLLRVKARDPSWRKWSGPAPACWYDDESFNRRISATIADDIKHDRQRTLRDFVATFKGCTRSDTRQEILDAVNGARVSLPDFFNKGHSPQRVEKLLNVMRTLTKAVPAKDLGLLGKDHFAHWFAAMGMSSAFQYKRLLIDNYDGLPYVLETAFGYCGIGRARQILRLNFSPRLSDPFGGLGAWSDADDDEDIEGTGLEALLTHRRVTTASPVTFALHLVCPRLMFVDKGKTELDVPARIGSGIVTSVEAVTKQWMRTIKTEERDASARVRRAQRLACSRESSIKDAAYEVMEAAYLKASDNSELPAKARQIMYAARPDIQERTGKPLDDNYFTQTLLPDYQQEHDVDWNVVYDARGHFTEPHTGHTIGLGTTEVDEYLSEIAPPQLLAPELRPAHIETRGPDGAFSAVMFVEKEGFDELWEAVNLAERYDLAIKSTKGMPNTAVRKLTDQMCGAYGIPLLVLHDFDKSGFSILGTLKNDTRRYSFENRIEVIDLGLRMADIRGLQHEDVSDRGDEGARRANLRQNGATAKEAEFLLQRRVELNAMTSRQLVNFVERKLRQHGIGKIVPDKAELAEAYRHFAHGQEAEAIIRRELAKLDGSAKIAVPADLDRQVQRYLKQNPTHRWDQAVQAVLAKERPR